MLRHLLIGRLRFLVNFIQCYVVLKQFSVFLIRLLYTFVSLCYPKDAGVIHTKARYLTELTSKQEKSRLLHVLCYPYMFIDMSSTDQEELGLSDSEKDLQTKIAQSDIQLRFVGIF